MKMLFLFWIMGVLFVKYIDFIIFFVIMLLFLIVFCVIFILCIDIFGFLVLLFVGNLIFFFCMGIRYYEEYLCLNKMYGDIF